MAERFKPTRRVNLALTERGWRNLKKFAGDAGLDEGALIATIGAQLALNGIKQFFEIGS